MPVSHDPSYTRETNPLAGDPTHNLRGFPAWYSSLHHGHAIQTRAQAKTPFLPYTKTERVAPLHALQKTAEQAAVSSLDRQKQSDTYKLMRDEIDQSRHRDPFQEMNPYLREAAKTPDQGYIQDYLKRFHQNVITPMWNEKTAEFLERTNPAIAGDFASAGAYNSGAREAVQRRTARDLAKNLQHETGRLLTGAEERAMEYGHRHGMKNLSMAELTGKTTQQNRELGLLSANALNNAEKAQTEQERQGAEMLGQYGYRQQEQRQREIEELRKAHHEELDYPKNQLNWEANILNSHPTPLQMSSFTPAPAPPPPNWSAIGASALQQIPGINATQPRKSGGRVRGYAPGGQVLPPPYADSQLPGFNTPEMQQVRSTAQELGHTHPNNAALSMGIAGATMGESMGGPWGAYSRGNKAGFENHQNVEQTQYLNKERGANLMAKINDSRLAQHTVLNEYAQKQKDFAETKRLHDAQIGHYAAQNENLRREKGKPNIVDGHQIMVDPETGKASASPIEGFTRVNKRHDALMLKKENRDVESAQKDGEAGRKALPLIQNMQKLLPDIGATGPAVGMLPNRVVTAFGGDLGKRQTFEAEGVKALISEMNQIKGNQSDSDRAAWEKSVPSLSKDPDALKLMLHNAKLMAERSINYEEYIEGALEQGIPLAEAKQKWREYVEANPLFEAEKKAPSKKAAGNSNISQQISKIDEELAALG